MAEYIQVCGCRVSVETSVTGRYEWGRIVYCPRHAAADAMHEACKNTVDECTECFDGNQIGNYLEDGGIFPCPVCHKSRAALALADGDKE